MNKLPTSIVLLHKRVANGHRGNGSSAWVHASFSLNSIPDVQYQRIADSPFQCELKGQKVPQFGQYILCKQKY